MRMLSCGLLALGWLLSVAAAGVEAPADSAPDAPPRTVNGKVLEGVLTQATPEGLVMQTPRGSVTYPWKYLSPGTRNRFEIPMLAELKAKAEAEAKAAAAKAAQEQKEAEAKAAREKKAAEAKAAKAAAAKAVTNAVATNAVAAATNAPADGK